MTVQRDVARGLLFDGDRMLMIHWRDPVTGHEFLEPPGGLCEPGESFEDTVRREIAEESGMTDVRVDDFVTEIRHMFTFAEERYDCLERYYLCRLVGRARTPAVLDPIEEKGIVGVEWVRVRDLVSYPAGLVEPPDLLGMLRDLGRIPAS
jgi:8-oxo-dGTP pyrophosphatase MutT (NUDIX family)